MQQLQTVDSGWDNYWRHEKRDIYIYHLVEPRTRFASCNVNLGPMLNNTSALFGTLQIQRTLALLPANSPVFLDLRL